MLLVKHCTRLFSNSNSPYNRVDLRKDEVLIPLTIFRSSNYRIPKNLKERGIRIGF